MLRSTAPLKGLGLALPYSRPRQQLGRLRRVAPKRRSAARLAAHNSTAAGSNNNDDPLPPRPNPPSIAGLRGEELIRTLDRFLAEEAAYKRAVQRRSAPAEARKAASVPPLPPAPTPPLACLAAEWPPVADSTLPENSAARTAVAEAAAAAAVAFARAALGHEAAAEAAYQAAATKPASALSSAGEEWLRAGAAWRKAFDSLAAARRAQPGAGIAEEAAAEVEAAQRFKRQLRGLPGRVADEFP
ncbi:hypothetical protein ABPG77_000815 [Micractinium sp. CCAP 211/92]